MENSLTQNQRQMQNLNSTYSPKIQLVNGIKISYFEKGQGDPILFFHGIPTNSQLWRNIVAPVSSVGRAIAFDLPGYGQSGIASGKDFSIQSQYAYVKGFIDALNLKNITLVVHDLGSLYGIKYAVENPESIKQIVLMESVFMPTKDWYIQLPISAKLMFRLLSNYKRAEKWIVTKNWLPKMMLKMGTLKKLNADDIRRYTACFDGNIENRQAMISGPNPATFPKNGISKNKGDFADEFNKNARGLIHLSKKIPLLIFYANPGMITAKGSLDYAKKNFEKLSLVSLGKGKHFLQEDLPIEIANNIISWMKLN